MPSCKMPVLAPGCLWDVRTRNPIEFSSPLGDSQKKAKFKASCRVPTLILTASLGHQRTFWPPPSLAHIHCLHATVLYEAPAMLCSLRGPGGAQQRVVGKADERAPLAEFALSVSIWACGCLFCSGGENVMLHLFFSACSSSCLGLPQVALAPLHRPCPFPSTPFFSGRGNKGLSRNDSNREPARLSCRSLHHA